MALQINTPTVREGLGLGQAAQLGRGGTGLGLGSVGCPHSSAGRGGYALLPLVQPGHAGRHNAGVPGSGEKGTRGSRAQTPFLAQPQLHPVASCPSWAWKQDITCRLPSQGEGHRIWALLPLAQPGQGVAQSVDAAELRARAMPWCRLPPSTWSEPCPHQANRCCLFSLWPNLHIQRLLIQCRPFNWSHDSIPIKRFQCRIGTNVLQIEAATKASHRPGNSASCSRYPGRGGHMSALNISERSV